MADESKKSNMALAMSDEAREKAQNDRNVLMDSITNLLDQNKDAREQLASDPSNENKQENLSNLRHDLSEVCMIMLKDEVVNDGKRFNAILDGKEKITVKDFAPIDYSRADIYEKIASKFSAQSRILEQARQIGSAFQGKANASQFNGVSGPDAGKSSSMQQPERQV